MSVEALLNGGLHNPLLRLNASVAASVCAAAAKVPTVAPTCRVLGFTGWRAQCFVGGESRGISAVDDILFRHPDFLALDAATRAHIVSESAVLAAGGNKACSLPAVDATAPNADCEGDAPIRGPDDPTQVHYDVATDDEGEAVGLELPRSLAAFSPA